MNKSGHEYLTFTKTAKHKAIFLGGGVTTRSQALSDFPIHGRIVLLSKADLII